MQKPLVERFKTAKEYVGYDHIIVGSGLGGLTAGAWLAKSGKRVLILEQHYVPGGFTHSFKRKNGFKWDVGVHYVGNMAADGSLHKLFSYISNNQLKWTSMGDVYDVARIEGKEYEFRKGKENFRNQMVAYFPSESEAIDAYLQLVEKSNSRANLFFIEKAFRPILQHTLGVLFRKRFNHFSDQTTYRVLSKISDNERLIAVLCAQYGNYGLPPKESSFAAHALVVGHYLEGGYYPVGGAEKIAEYAMETIVANGGTIAIRAEVEEIKVVKNRVVGVVVNGEEIACKSVISNVGVKNTFGSLVKNIQDYYPNFSKQNIAPSSGHLALYLGLDASAESLGLPMHNTWCHLKNEQSEAINEVTLENAQDALAYISFPSAKDPEWHKQHPHKSTIQAITAGRFDWFAAFQNQPWMKRDEQYQKIKRHFKDKMLEKLYQEYPQIKSHVVAIEVSSPLSTQHFSKYQQGEIYGLAHSPSRFRLPFLRPDTKIKGLRLVGQDVTIVGVAGAMLSGILGAVSILKWRVWRNFRQMGKMNLGVTENG